MADMSDVQIYLLAGLILFAAAAVAMSVWDAATCWIGVGDAIIEFALTLLMYTLLWMFFSVVGIFLALVVWMLAHGGETGWLDAPLLRLHADFFREGYVFIALSISVTGLLHMAVHIRLNDFRAKLPSERQRDVLEATVSVLMWSLVPAAIGVLGLAAGGKLGSFSAATLATFYGGLALLMALWQLYLLSGSKDPAPAAKTTLEQITATLGMIVHAWQRTVAFAGGLAIFLFAGALFLVALQGSFASPGLALLGAVSFIFMVGALYRMLKALTGDPALKTAGVHGGARTATARELEQAGLLGDD